MRKSETLNLSQRHLLFLNSQKDDFLLLYAFGLISRIIATLLTIVTNESLPIFGGEITPGAILRKVFYTLLREDPHVNLKAHERKDGEGEHRQDYHIAQVLHGFYHSADNGFQT